MPGNNKWKILNVLILPPSLFSLNISPSPMPPSSYPPPPSHTHISIHNHSDLALTPSHKTPDFVQNDGDKASQAGALPQYLFDL